DPHAAVPILPSRLLVLAHVSARIGVDHRRDVLSAAGHHRRDDGDVLGAGRRDWRTGVERALGSEGTPAWSGPGPCLRRPGRLGELRGLLSGSRENDGTGELLYGGLAVRPDHQRSIPGLPTRRREYLPSVRYRVVPHSERRWRRRAALAGTRSLEPDSRDERRRVPGPVRDRPAVPGNSARVPSRRTGGASEQ